MPPAPSTPAVITGVGLVTPLGASAVATARALLDGRCTSDWLRVRDAAADRYGVARTEAGLSSDPVGLSRRVGSVARFAPWPEDPAIELADAAAREALLDAGVLPARGGGTARDSSGVRTIVASSKGAVLALLAPGAPGHAAAATIGAHGLLCGRLRERLGLGETTAIVSACATSLAALHQARLEIEEGRAERVLVVAVEAALHPVFIHSYANLGVLAPTAPPESHRTLALDRRRAGFTLVECAAAAIVERADLVPPGRRVRAALRATALGTEPFDVVRPAERFRTVARLVRACAPPGTRIALVHPHATATPDNDEREMLALAAALEPAPRAEPGSPGHVPVYASKGALGHPLGAAGLVNVALSCMLARFGRVPPMPWLDEPIDTPFALARDGAALAPGAHIVVSAGFGGHVAAACIEPTTR